MPDNPAILEAGTPSAVPIRRLLTGLFLVILLGAMEQTIVAVALPGIARQLDGFGLMAWVVSAYLIASTVVTPVYGKLGDIFGRRAALTCALSLFVAASLACALARTMPQLILFRVLQGIGGGGLLSVSMAAIADTVAPRERGRYQAYTSAIWTVASLAGPAVGGYLTEHLSWRWIFWINLPLGALALLMLRRALPSGRRASAESGIDYTGIALFSAGISTLLMAVTQIGHGEAAGSPHNLAMLAGGLLVLGLFVRHERRAANPILPMSLFRNRTVAICFATLFLNYVQMISISVLLPLRLQVVANTPVDVAALHLLPMTLTSPIGAFLGGRLMSASGRYMPFQFAGAVLAALAAFGLAWADPHRGWMSGTALVAIGVGIGMQLPTAVVATQNAVSPAQIGLATALTSFARLLGGASGVAVLTAVLITFLRQSLPDLPTAAGEDGLSTMFRLLLANGSGIARAGAAAAFERLFAVSAFVSLLTPVLVLCLKEKELRSGKS
jgi:EmrB/QacA subfamily drug resistance transporter